MSLISPMVRTALFVRNLDKSATFYKEVFELEDVYAQGELQHAAATKLLGMPPETNVRYKILRSAGFNKGMVGLFELTDPAPPPIHRRLDVCNAGEGCLVFYCGNLDIIHRRLMDAGSVVLCPPTYLEVDIEDGAVKTAQRGQREMTFRDPDEILINLIERDPSSDD
ncbi:MAG: hypothetical protein RIC29_09055 [Rhodospirillaceae bacterium]